ncbi:PqiC family protein [Methylococcus sp. Mc7]|nr:PqiC family protein [Methylococcus sp. Mc7]
MREPVMRSTFLAASVAALLLGGCGTSPDTRFYVLSAAQEPVRPAVEREIALGVGPVELPEYLDRPQIVTRTGQNELQLAEFDKWAESLKGSVTQVLAENLAAYLPSRKVVVYPWKRSAQVDYQLVVKVIRFEGAGGESVLNVRWSVSGGDGKTELLVRESRYAEPAVGTDYRATVAAMSRTLARFSRDVAEAVRGLSRV